MEIMNRNRYLYFVFIVLTILAGLASRHFAHMLPKWTTLYLGDALWALMVFFIVGFLLKRRNSSTIALFAIAFSFCIEISQLYHAPFIDSVRATRLGGLILGFGFLWTDLLCYVVGISVGFCLEWIFERKIENNRAAN